MPIIPFILTGHTRDITHVTFNRDGDLLFTCSKDKSCQVWYTTDGKRLGSYDHDGALTCCEPTANSKYLLTTSADSRAQIYEVETGKLLRRFQHDNPLKHCSWSVGNQMFAVVQQPSRSIQSSVFIWTFEADDIASCEQVRTLVIGPSDPVQGAFRKAVFTDVENSILAIHDDGCVTLWDCGDEAIINHAKLADKELTDVYLTHDRGLALITSRNHKAYLIDVKTLEIVKQYETDRPLNTGVISPILNHTLLAGGQDKHEVTLSGTTEGHFEVEFWHTIYEERLESVVGHYGPVNSLAISRDGKIFATGSEDGNIRIYNFDEGYFKCTY